MNLPSNPSETFVKNNPHLYRFQEAAIKSSTMEIESSKKLERSSKRIRQSTKPLMNKLEFGWYSVLSIGQWNGKLVSSLMAQSLRIKIASGAWYKPDMSCLLDGHVTCFECKGNKGKNIDRGKLALKVAASQYPWIDWWLVWRDPVSGVWRTQLVLP